MVVLRAALSPLHGKRVLVVSEADVLSKITLIGTVVNNTLRLPDVSKSTVVLTQSTYIMNVTIIAIAAQTLGRRRVFHIVENKTRLASISSGHGSDGNHVPSLRVGYNVVGSAERQIYNMPSNILCVIQDLGTVASIDREQLLMN